jgi:spermidine synthase
VVIVFLPFPSSFQINRYYTLEFMTDVKKCLNPDGIFTFQLPITGSYLNEGSVNIYSSLFRSCKQVFRYVSIFPGQNCYIVASDSGIKTNIGQLIEYKNIKNDYVNSYYIDEAEMLRNSSDIMKQLDPGVKPNTDFRPVAINGFYHYWLNRFHIEFRSFRLYALLVAALIILVLAFASPAFSGMFAAGFTGSALQVILILSFQIVCGYILRSIGLFTAVFMAGLAMGSMFRRKLLTSSSTRVLVYLQLILAGLSALVPVMVQFSDNINHLPVMVHLLYMVLILLISATSGIVFSISVNNSGIPKEVSLPQVYGADLAGSSLGAFVTILLLIPAAGIKPAAYLAGLLNGVVAVIMIIRFRRTNNG